jgi:ABC-type protease/lipase transport system fused ATPase/permease subunit
MLLILDEPDAHLDAEGEEALKHAVARAKERGAAIIFVSQKPGMVMLTDQLLVLQAGKIAQLGPRAEILRTVMRKEQGAS